MMAIAANIILRILGIMIGWFGVYLLFIAFAISMETMAVFAQPDSHNIKTAVGALSLSLALLFTASFFIYIGCLACFKFSPWAIKCICGACSFFIWALAISIITHNENTPPSLNFVRALLGLFALIVIYYAYRASTNYFTRKIFLAPNAQV